MKFSIIILLAALPFTITAQETRKSRLTLTIADEIRRNFSYDSLANISCSITPPGFYMISFKVDKRGEFLDFKFSNDSLKDLGNFFIDAIKKSRLALTQNELEKLKNHTVCQGIYFNNIISCHPWRDKNNEIIFLKPDSTVNFSAPYDKEIIQLLSGQLMDIEKSINSPWPFLDQKNVFMLPFALINNENPSVKKKGPGFINDARKIDINNLTEKEKAEMADLIKRIEEIKKKRSGN